MNNSEEREALEDWFFEKLRTTFTPGEIKMLIEEYKQKKKELGNLPEEQETYSCSGFYCPPAQPPQGYYTCPNCEGTGDLGGEYTFNDDGEDVYEEETCNTCKGKGYITLKELNKWNKKHTKTFV